MSSLTAAELALLHWLVGAVRADWLDLVMLGVSWAARSGLLFAVIGLAVVAWRRDGRAMMAWWRLLLAVWVASVLVGDVLKPLMPRERPFRVDSGIAVVGSPAEGSSMPSGHAATAVAGAYALALLWPRGRALAWALAALVLFSRLYLGVHYPTDVLVGGLVGWGLAWFTTAATRAEGVDVTRRADASVRA